MKLHIAAPVAGKGYAMVESSDGPLWWQAIDVPEQGLELTIPVDKTRIATISISVRWWCVPAINLVPRRQNAPWGYYTYRWG